MVGKEGPVGLWTRLTVLGAAGGAAVLAVTSGLAGPAGAQGEVEQPSIVETYEYPSADKIFAEQGIRLIKGDGRILLVECGDRTGVLQVWSRIKNGDEPFCFQVKGGHGYLTMMLPKVYGTIGDQRSALTAKVTAGGATETVDVRKDGWTEIGEGTTPGSAPATLLELQVSK
jgi:hypothetical protein